MISLETPMPLAQKTKLARLPARDADPWMARLLAWGLILVGASLRARMYLANRSLWRDEAALALNIIHRSFGGLFRPLDYDQGAPVGFLMIQKLATTLFGGNEFVLRLWPTLASILILPIFYRACRLLISRRASLIALAVLALAADRSFYWIDNKQYSTDAFVTVCLLWLAARAFTESADGSWRDIRRMIALAIAGTIAIWFSHPAVFVLSGIGLAAAVRWLGQRPRRGAGEIVLLAAVWAGSFLANYFLCLRNLTHSDYLQRYWSEIARAFAPPPTSFQSIGWYKRSFLELFHYPFAQELEGLAALAFLWGAVMIYRRRKLVLAMLLTPILAALCASGLHQYPFDSRLLLFVVPLTTIALAAGVDFLWQGNFRMVGILALALLMISPITQTLATLRDPPKNCEIRDAVEFIAAHREPGDVFYLFPTARYGFLYYQPRYGLDGVAITVGSRHVAGLDNYAGELEQFAGKRVWVLFEDPFNGDPVREGQFLVEQPRAMDILDSLGRCVWRKEPFNEYVACYDLREPPAHAVPWLPTAWTPTSNKTQ